MEDGTVADERQMTVEDMFDLAAPSLKTIIGRLVDVDRNETIDLCKEDSPITLGRSKELTPPFKIENDRLSSKHCVIELTVSNHCYIVDQSTNGTFINGARIKKGEKVPLHGGEVVSLLNVAAEGNEKLDFTYLQVAKPTTRETLVEELTCGICKSIFSQPFSATPCMHTFCRRCIGEWVKKNYSCPECRCTINEIRPTHKLAKLVEQLTEGDPSLNVGEVPEEECFIPSTGMVLNGKKRSRSDEHSSADEDNSICSDEEVSHSEGESICPAHTLYVPHHFVPSSAMHPRPCRECASSRAADSFQCPPGQIHLSCAKCKTSFPSRPLCGVSQKCELCSLPLCDIYLGRCANPAGVGYLNRVDGHKMNHLPLRLFGGNTVEQQILSDYMSVAGIVVSQLWSECLAKFTSGAWIPNLVSCTAISAGTVTCLPCAQKVFSELVFHFRRAIPRDALPPTVVSRPNCWHGIQCRTQFRNVEHAKRYNHVCPQEKRKE